MSERPPVLEIGKYILEVLQLVMAIKDAYNDISKRHNRGDKISRRVKQLLVIWRQFWKPTDLQLLIRSGSRGSNKTPLINLRFSGRKTLKRKMIGN